MGGLRKKVPGYRMTIDALFSSTAFRTIATVWAYGSLICGILWLTVRYVIMTPVQKPDASGEIDPYQVPAKIGLFGVLFIVQRWIWLMAAR